MPAAVVSSTIKAACLFAAGQAVATGVISTQVVALTEEVLKSMLLTKLKLVTAVMAALAAVALGGGLLFYASSPAGAASPEPVTLARAAAPGGKEDRSKDAETLNNTLLTLEKAW